MAGSPFPPIYLASGSPRRRELLTQIGVPFERLLIDVPEIPQPTESPSEFVLRLALDKAVAGIDGSRTQGLSARPVLGADTAVVVDGEILGKPENTQAGLAMLTRIAGSEHQVFCGVAIVAGARSETALSTSTVRFRPMSMAEIQAYLDTGEGLDKAGGYAVQGLAAEFIEHIDGSYSGIMGLPLFETAALLRRAAKW